MIVGLGGGIGATRLWCGIAKVWHAADFTILVNTADDFSRYGLRICPDLDTVIYGLANVRDPVRGWGLTGESWRTMDQLRALGQDAWFNLGDLDLATHLLRSGMRAEKRPLSEITARVAQAHGVRQTILPMSEGDVETWITASGGVEIHYQEYLIKHQCNCIVENLNFRGLAEARAPAAIFDAISSADLIIFGPSNPIASIEPILSVPGIRDALRTSTALKIAVSPIVHNVPITDPGEANRARSRAALLLSRGLPHRAHSAAKLYGDLIDLFVLDEMDREDAPMIEALGIRVTIANTLIPTTEKAVALAKALMKFTETFRGRDGVS